MTRWPFLSRPCPLLHQVWGHDQLGADPAGPCLVAARNPAIGAPRTPAAGAGLRCGRLLRSWRPAPQFFCHRGRRRLTLNPRQAAVPVTPASTAANTSARRAAFAERWVAMHPEPSRWLRVRTSNLVGDGLPLSPTSREKIPSGPHRRSPCRPRERARTVLERVIVTVRLPFQEPHRCVRYPVLRRHPSTRL
jgi:hypothetical protein